MKPETRTIKIRTATYRQLKLLAADKGITLLDLLDQLVPSSPVNVATNVASGSSLKKKEGI